MKKNINVILLVFSLIVFGCSNSERENQHFLEDKTKNDDDPTLPFDKRIKNFVERKLNIAYNENYRLKIHEAHLNDDGKTDFIITINRLEYAINKVSQDKQLSKAAEIGFFGDYNYIIYYSSITNTFSEPIAFGSSPQRELGISFENISSTKHQDLIVDYYIRNSQFRKVFLMMNDKLIYAFHWNIYDGWGTDELESYCFEYAPGAYSEVKDIVVKQGKMKNISKEEDYFVIEPNIECTDLVLKRFFFNSKDGKYYTPN